MKLNSSYFEQIELWGKNREFYQVQVLTDILDLLPRNVNSVLDAGCGDGFILNALPQELFSVGLDLSTEALKHVIRKKCLGSIINLPFPDSSFDLVMSNDVIEHLPEPLMLQALKELSRVAAKYVLITVPHEEDLSANLAKCEDCETIYHINGHLRTFDEKTIRSLDLPGFVLKEVRYSGDINGPPLDPTTRLRNEAGIYRVWKMAICPNCGSKKQLGEKEVASFFYNALDVQRSSAWAETIRHYGSYLKRTEIIGLFLRENHSWTPRYHQVFQKTTNDLLLVDFSNQLQSFPNGLLTWADWPRFVYPESAVISEKGIRRRLESSIHPEIAIKIPVLPRAGDQLEIEVFGERSDDRIILYSIDGLTGTRLILKSEVVGVGQRFFDVGVPQGLLPDQFGAAFEIHLFGDLILHTMVYRFGNGEEITAPYVHLEKGYNVLSLGERESCVVSWGLLAEHAGHFPFPRADAGISLINFLNGWGSLSKTKILIDFATDVSFSNIRDLSKKLEEKEILRHNAEKLLEEKEILRHNAEMLYKNIEQLYQKSINRPFSFKSALKGLIRKIKRRFLLSLHPSVPQELFPEPWQPFDVISNVQDNRLKVLVLSHMFPHPQQLGSGSFIFEQVKALQARGIDVRVLVGRPYWIRSRNLLRAWNSNRKYNAYLSSQRWWNYKGIPIRYVYYKVIWKFWSHSYFYSQAMNKIIGEVREDFRFEIIHAHTSYLDGSAARIIAARFNIPYLITEHTGPFSILTSHPIIKYFTVKALNHANSVVAVSRFLKKQISAHLKPNIGELITVIPNGVDEKIFRPMTLWAPNPEAPRILFVGYFVPVKNLPILLKAFSSVRQKLPGSTLKLVGCGETVVQEQEILDQIQHLGLEKSVCVTGFLSQEKVALAMRQECDILVLSSQLETFGCVLTEAMSSGRPVVATRCGGPEDIVISEAVGELCMPNSVVALSEAIIKVTQRLREYDQNLIRSVAVAHFSYRLVAELIHKEYSRLIVSLPSNSRAKIR